jgi:hypothetical protein
MEALKKFPASSTLIGYEKTPFLCSKSSDSASLQGKGREELGDDGFNFRIERSKVVGEPLSPFTISFRYAFRDW